MLFRIADPATVQLFNSGVALATALTVVVGLGVGFGEVQWIAIATQLCGVIVSQLGTEQGSAYPVPIFFFVMVYGFLSAFAGVYNQNLNQSSSTSLHADNMVLFSAGSGINLAIHLALGWWNPERPGLLDGLDDPAAMVLVFGSVFVGLASTVVYKHADAVTKCFATSISAGILLFISMLFFGTEAGVFAIVGTMVVFIAVWIYFAAPNEQGPDHILVAADTSYQTPSSQDRGLWGENKGEVQEGLLPWGSSHRSTGWLSWIALAIKGTATIAIVVAASNAGSLEPLIDMPANPPQLPSEQPGVLNSPLENTLAFVRWNRRGEFIPMIETYRPFFHDLHYSIPVLTNDANLTSDGLEDGSYVYKQVADTMQLILDEQPEVNGLLYYHFDSWIDPMLFGNMDSKSIWYPDSLEPKFICTDRVKSLPWVFDARDDARRAKVAAKILEDRNSGYKVDIDQFCDGSSDIYYIPRRFFEDFIYLSAVFYDLKVFHEIAIPTMVTIIDNTHRASIIGDSSQISPLDCWGSSRSSSSGPSRHDTTWRKCGHKLDYSDRDVTLAFYDRLAQSARWLGTKGPKTSGREEEKNCAWATNPWWSGWICPDTLSNQPSVDRAPRLTHQKPSVWF
ncbi:MAG: hypothetical protein M1840_007704 [Geoglossum simile]|nr:MAG: hypothetical protein M1840_007704 [Geoglossum simile]